MNEQTKQEIVEAKVYRKFYQGFFESKVSGVVVKTNRVDSSLPNLQTVHTPYELCHDMVVKLCEYSGSLAGKEILVFNLEFAEVLLYDEVGFGAEASRITFVTDCLEKFTFSRSGRYAGIKRVFKSFDDIKKLELNMKFDVVIMNPPYQTKSDKDNKKTQPIWDKFVARAMDVVKKDGFVAAIHPSGWRGGNDVFRDAKIIKEKQLEYLEIHNEADGLKMFGATTRYDWYVLKNQPVEHFTEIVDQNKEKSHLIIKDLPCIPNCMLEKVVSMIANGKEKTVELICDSTYHTQRDHVSKDQNDEFKYKIVYSTPVEKPTIWYSSIQNGHFGIPKFIFNPSRPIGYVIDYKGEYGMSQFCIGIIGDEKYLNMIEGVFANQKINGFSEFMESCHFTDKIFNKDIFSKFRKDFWKEFI